MSLQHDNYKEVILAYTKSDWQPLLDLIPKIEETRKFYEVGGGEEVEKNVFEFPYYISAPVINEFLKVVYQIPIIVDFAWMDWSEGKLMVRDKNFDYDTVDIPTKCQLITAYVRSDRFSDGTLALSFERGVMLRILKSIQKQLS